jgi:hypothetical protein
MLDQVQNFVTVVVEWTIIRSVCLSVSRNKVTRLIATELLSKWIYAYVV